MSVVVLAVGGMTDVALQGVTTGEMVFGHELLSAEATKPGGAVEITCCETPPPSKKVTLGPRYNRGFE